MNPLLIPAPDPWPLPAPAWLFHALLLVTFFVHVLFLNATLGTAVIGAVHGAGGERGRPARAALLRILPVSVSLTITTGVAPLLFVQVLYGQAFYPATILLGWTWLAVPLLLIVGYAAVYQLKFRGPGSPAAGWPGLIALCFLAVAAIHVTANVLQLTPGRWVAVATGQARAAADTTLLPRLLHFVLGSLAVGGMVLALWPGRHGDAEAGARLARLGARWALLATGLQMADGFWFVFALPLDILKPLVTGHWPATPLLAVAMGLGFLTLMLLAQLGDPLRQRALARGAGAALFLTILAMILVRDTVRGLYLSPAIQPARLPVAAQWDLVVLFAAVLVLGLLSLVWVGRRVRADRAAAGARAKE